MYYDYKRTVSYARDNSDDLLDMFKIYDDDYKTIHHECIKLRYYWDSWHHHNMDETKIDLFKFYLFVLYFIMTTKMSLSDGNKSLFIQEIPLDSRNHVVDDLPDSIEIPNNEKLYLSMVYVLEYIEEHTKHSIESIPFKVLHDMEHCIYPFTLTCYGDVNDPLYMDYESKFNKLLLELDSDLLFDV